MSPAGKADPSTPLMRLQRRKRAVMIFLLFLAVCVILLATTVLAVNDGRNYRRLLIRFGTEDYLATPPPPQPPSVQRYRRIGRIPLARPRLVAPPTGGIDRLLQFSDLPAEERCMRLAAGGMQPASFRAAQQEWECIFQQETGSTPEPSVLFVQVKGPSPDLFRSFRIKLSLLDPSVDERMIGLTLDVIDRFGLALSPESRGYLRDQLERKSEFSSLLENYRISFEREGSDEPRFNLLILPRPAIVRCDVSTAGRGSGPMQSTILAAPIGCLPLQAGPRFPASNGIEPH